MNIDAEHIAAAGNVNIENQFNFFQSESQTLPSSIAMATGFVGREKNLQELKDWYKSGNRVFVLHGLGGVGKTSLAHKFAEEIKADFDAIIYLNLQGDGKTSISYLSVMIFVLRHFNQNVTADTPPSVIESHFISLLNEKRVLLFLDNAKERIQIEPLNKTKNTCLLVTSRESFVLTGGRSRVISQMTMDDAKTLLFSIAPIERFDGQADILAHLAGYLPIALLAIASILAENDMEKAVDLVHKYEEDRNNRLQLADPHRGNFTVFASFELSYEVLNEKLQRYWRRLSVFPTDFDKESAKVALNAHVEKDDYNEILKKLYKSNLIEWDKENDRFRLHDLVRDFLLEKSNEDELLSINIQLVNYYVSIHSPLEKCNKIEDFDSRFKEAYHSYQAKLFDRAVFIFDKMVNRKIRVMGHGRLIITERLKLIGKSQRPLSEAFNYGALAVCYESLEDFQTALNFYEKAIVVYRRLNKIDNIAIMLLNIGNIWLELGKKENNSEKVRNGFYNLTAALPLSRQAKDKLTESAILNNIGGVYDYEQNKPASKYFVRQALKIQMKLKDDVSEGILSLNIGIHFFEEGQFEKALNHFEQLLPKVCKSKDRFTEGKVLGWLGLTLYNLGRHKEGCDSIKKALEIAREIEDKSSETFWLESLKKCK